MNADYEQVLCACNWISELVAHVDHMSAAQRQFVEQLAARFDRYGDETFLSVSQFAWIEALAKKHLRAAA